jgi:hypothetical protein
MTPTDFSASVEEGSDLGVLVGYEFEVCIPREQFAQKKKVTPKKFRDYISDNHVIASLNVTELSPQKFDSVFTIKPAAVRRLGFTSMSDAYSKYCQGLSRRAREDWERTPESTRLAIKNIIDTKYRGKYQRVLDSMTDKNGRWTSMALLKVPETTEEIKYVIAVHHIAHGMPDTHRGKTALENKYRQIIDMLNSYEDIIDDIANLDVFEIEHHFNKLFDYDPEVAVKELEYFIGDDFWDDERDYYNDDPEYTNAAKWLKQHLVATFGRKVNIFNDYHQSNKNLRDWYIEPDGSLDSEYNDSSAEIVTPPYPAKEAVAVLKDFYSLASQLKLYTGVEYNTGLHINVSIPRELDVLKLAVFLGDNYVLQQFGRERNEYAQGVLKRLQGRDDINIYLPQKQIMTDLNKIAANITDEHTASISNNGKYISFRHAGGDYLNKYDDVYNVVGRFVRAMVIASNPDLYRQEYYQKLSKLIPSKQQDNVGSVYPLISIIKSQGLPMLEVIGVRTNRIRADDFATFTQSAINRFLGDGTEWTWIARSLTTVGGVHSTAKDRMLSAFSSGINNPNPDEINDNTKPLKFWLGKVTPKNPRVLPLLSKFDQPVVLPLPHWHGAPMQGYIIVAKKFLPPDSLEAQTIMTMLLKQAKANLGSKSRPNLP